MLRQRDFRTFVDLPPSPLPRFCLETETPLRSWMTTVTGKYDSPQMKRLTDTLTSSPSARRLKYAALAYRAGIQLQY